MHLNNNFLKKIIKKYSVDTQCRQSFRVNWKVIGVSLLFILLIMASLLIGTYEIFNQPDGLRIFFITRVPRTISLMLSGCALAISGLVMQMLTQNKFVEPTTSSTLEWAGLGLLTCYILFPSASLVLRMSFAILFSFVGTIIFLFFLSKIKLQNSLMLPIVGIMLGSIVSAFSNFLALVSKSSQSLEIWFQGSFTNVSVGRYEYLWIIVISSALIFKFADQITLVGLGKSIASNLGVNYKRIVLIGTLLVSLTVGVVASVVGYLPFIGLIVPNLVSKLKGDHVRKNISYVAVGGMALILICDILARVIIMPFEIPVSVILGIVGAILFLFFISWKGINK